MAETHRVNREAIAKEFAKPQIDRAAIEGLRQQELELADRASKLAVTGFADLADVLTAEQRQDLIAFAHRFHGGTRNREKPERPNGDDGRASRGGIAPPRTPRSGLATIAPNGAHPDHRRRRGARRSRARLPEALRLRGHGGDHRGRGPAAPARRVERRAAGRDAAGPRRLRGLPPDPRGLRRAGADAHRARAGRGPHRRARDRRRRLPAQALQPARAAGAAARGAASARSRAARRPPSCASAGWRSTRTPAPSASTARSARSRATSSTCWWRSRSRRGACSGARR